MRSPGKSGYYDPEQCQTLVATFDSCNIRIRLLMQNDPKAELLARAQQEHIKFIDLQFTDVVGMVKNVIIPMQQFPDALDHGTWFEGSSVEGFARIAESDMYLVPDTNTFA